MIVINGIEYRNLQEQVYKNQDDLYILKDLISLIENKPTSGTYVLKCIDGVLTWVVE